CRSLCRTACRRQEHCAAATSCPDLSPKRLIVREPIGVSATRRVGSQGALPRGSFHAQRPNSPELPDLARQRRGLDGAWIAPGLGLAWAWAWTWAWTGPWLGLDWAWTGSVATLLSPRAADPSSPPGMHVGPEQVFGKTHLDCEARSACEPPCR